MPYKLDASEEQELRRLGSYLGKKGLDELLAAINSNYRPVVQLQPTPSAALTPITSPPEYIRPPALQSFDFDVMTVDAKGAVTKQRKGQARYFVEDLGGGVMLTMVEIPAGVFQMGSTESEVQRALADAKRYTTIDIESFNNETPRHQVKVPTFFMSKYEVTQAQWRAVAEMREVKQPLKPDPSRFRGYDQHPVEEVSWEDAVEFCARLSGKTRRIYRLPTEAEWEYACRAGTTTPFAFGETITPELVNYQGEHPYGEGPEGEFRETTIDVGSLGVANGFGLYDMHGNVMEWCLDVWHDNYDGAPADGGPWLSGDTRLRVVRGGSELNDAFICRSAFRNRVYADNSRANIGFRVVAVVRP